MEGAVEQPQRSLRHQQTAKQISNLIQSNRKQQHFGKKHIDRYLYTFAFEIGSDLPSEDMLKTIFLVLLGNEENAELGVDQEHFQTLVQVCLRVYDEAKRTPIGGIFERIVMGLKQALYYSKLEAACQPLE
jgi:hypothetical protein